LNDICTVHPVLRSFTYVLPGYRAVFLLWNKCLRSIQRDWNVDNFHATKEEVMMC